MAILKMGPIAQAASGSIGSVTFGLHRGIQTARMKPRHRTPRTAKAIAQRTYFRSQMQAWADASASVRLAWTNAAQYYSFVDALGQTRKLSPFQLWCKLRALPDCNIIKGTFILSSRTAPVKTFALDAKIAAPGFTAALTYHAVESACVMLYGWRSFRDHEYHRVSQWTFLGCWRPQPASIDLSDEWEDQLGAPISGEYVRIRALTMAPGKIPGPYAYASDFTY
jgi:hypothetical protein